MTNPKTWQEMIEKEAKDNFHVMNYQQEKAFKAGAQFAEKNAQHIEKIKDFKIKVETALLNIKYGMIEGAIETLEDAIKALETK